MIRLIGGEFKNIDIKSNALSGKKTRPSLAIVRKSVFSLLGDFTGKKCLDLFAGSGALGFEALSRNADRVIFIDKDRKTTDQIRKNIELIKCSSRTEVHNTDFRMALKALLKRNVKFDIVFIDPPYRFTKAYDAASAVIEAKLLSNDGMGVLLSGINDEVLIKKSEIIKERTLAHTRITIFKGV